jgi:hypothetical protein
MVSASRWPHSHPRWWICEADGRAVAASGPQPPMWAKGRRQLEDSKNGIPIRTIQAGTNRSEALALRWVRRRTHPCTAQRTCRPCQTPRACETLSSAPELATEFHNDSEAVRWSTGALAENQCDKHPRLGSRFRCFLPATLPKPGRFDGIEGLVVAPPNSSKHSCEG